MKEECKKTDFLIKYRRWIFPREVEISILKITKCGRLSGIVFRSNVVGEGRVCAVVVDSDRNTACIGDIHIRKRFRRKGIGTKIIRKLEEILKNDGVKVVDGGDVEEGSGFDGAVQFWKRMDYSIEKNKQTGRYKIKKVL